ncbi:M24 family metallopeptidase [Candidatus Peregrinibacteria bacterium]|nr:M24 family metallopeptidase [Candidatus Peregrinibacteria bacterium]
MPDLSRENIFHQEEPADLYAEHLASVRMNTGEALDAHDFDALVVHAGFELRQIGRDSTVLPLPHPEMSRWIGGLYPKDVPPAEDGVARLDYTLGHAVVFTPSQAKPRLYVESNPENRWVLQAGVPERADQFFEVVVSKTQEELWGKLRGALPKRTAFLGPETMPDVAWRRKERSLPHLVHAPEGLMDHLNWNRLKKTVYEIACMILATRKAALGHHAARAAFENSNPADGKVSEGSVLSAYLAGARITESDSPYQPIVAFGPDGAILHYFRPNFGVTAGSTLLIDAGAQHNGYAADVTCTHVREGVSAEFRQILAGPDSVQRELVEMVKPGVDFGEIQKQMYFKVAQLLTDAGVIVGCDAQRAAELGLAAAFILHSVGHSIGANVHDEGLLQVDESGRTPPMPKDPVLVGSGYNSPRGSLGELYAMTVEPGIYFDSTLRARLAARDEKVSNGTKTVDLVAWKLMERLARDGGMRIETNVITLRGGENVDITREYLPQLTNV